MSTANLHFFAMILVSLGVFILVIRIVMSADAFSRQFRRICWLATVVVVGGMLFGKFGATAGLPWWIYYPIPMLANVLLPPLLLKLNSRQTLVYLVLSFLSAPLIHAAFSFLLGWNEYMPFWAIPYWRSL